MTRKYSSQIRLASLLGLTAMTFTQTVSAAPNVGSVLAGNDRAQAEKAPALKVGSQQLRVLPSSMGTQGISAKSANGQANPVTMVMNSQGVVGMSRNEVLIAGIPTADARAASKSVLGRAVAVQSFDHMNLFSMRFATLAEAVQAQTTLAKALPNAQVTVPMQFVKPTLK